MAVIQALELRTSAGTYVDAIQHFYDAHWIQAANACDELRFTAPTAELPAGFDFDQQIWLRRGDAADVARKFIITEIQTVEGAADKTHVICYDYLSILNKLTISDFPGGDSDSTFNARTLLTTLLSQQSSISVGTLPPNQPIDYDDVHVSGTATILSVIQKIRSAIGGMIWVDNDYKLHWYTTRYTDQGFTLDLDRNMIEYKKTESRMGEDIQISYDVSVVDLSQIDSTDEGMFNIGMPITLTPAGELLYLTDIDQDLANPLQVRIALASEIDLSGRRPDVVDALTQMTQDTEDNTRRIENLEALDYDFDYGELDDITRIGLDWTSAGISDDVARADHQHGVDYGTTEDMGTLGIDDAGYLDEIARIDHSHEIPYGTDVQAVGTANAAGTSDDLARVDHIHEGQALDFADVSEIQPVGEAASAGTSGKVARADHVHVGATGTETGAAATAMGKLESLSSDGNKMSVYLYDAVEDKWDTNVTQIWKPWLLRASFFDGQTFTFADDTEITYSTSGVEKKYQRIASWTNDDDETVQEVQEIVPPYVTDPPEVINIMIQPNGTYVEFTPGRTWARAATQEAIEE